MDTMKAFAMGEANRGKPSMIFDWHKAAQIIKEKNAKSAEAGLSGDWSYTGGEILTDGNPTPEDDTYTYLASTWATPQLLIDGAYYDCFIMEGEEDNGWGSGTYWPQSAIDILSNKK